MAEEPVNAKEYEELARLSLPKMNFDYFHGGAEDEHTLKENVEAFKRIQFRPRVLVDVSSVDLSTTILGHRIDAPILIAPTGMHRLAHPDGEVATARAAAASNTIMVLSFSSSCKIEEVASSCDAVRFYQLYVLKRRDIAAMLVQRAESKGFKALVLTADAPRFGRREADIKNRMERPKQGNLDGLLSVDMCSVMTSFSPYFIISIVILELSMLTFFLSSFLLFLNIVQGGGSKLEAFAYSTRDPSLNWKDIEWLKSITNLPILIKGVLTSEDAKKAMEVGVDGVIVSNHGARQLDYSPATITVLEEVARAVAGKIPVLFDGGIRRGTDIFKALALGAKAVLVGRPVLYGLAAKGEYGVRRVLKMLRDELEITMALAGCPTLQAITRDHVCTENDRLRSRI